MTKEEYLQRMFYLQQMKPYELLQELLSIIHNDGGQLVSESGPARAVLEAEIKWHALQSKDAATPDSVSGGG